MLDGNPRVRLIRRTEGKHSRFGFALPDLDALTSLSGGVKGWTRTGEAVRTLVDDAAVACLHDVRVIHGRGTGVLRDAVRGELRRHPLVQDIRSESADGATIASLTD
jgi:hypothetical protein